MIAYPGLRSALLAIAFVFGGCASAVGTRDGSVSPPVDGAVIDALVAVDAVAPCRLSNGSFCAAGSQCPAGDGCNSCVCPAAGGSAACTRLFCVDASVDVARDTGTAICQDVPVVELRLPRVVRAGMNAPLAALGQAGNTSCSCTPQMRPSGSGLALQRCGCCDSCPCIDPPYLANTELGMLPVDADTVVEVGGMRASVFVVPADRMCVGNARIERVRVVSNESVTNSGPRRAWAEISGIAMRCSGDPLPYIEVRAGSPIFLEPTDCQNFDCDGPQSPHPFTTWVSLGVLPPGMHSLFYSPGISHDFVVR